jgi:hypothetical protein
MDASDSSFQIVSIASGNKPELYPETLGILRDLNALSI